jgi:cytochrome c-type biogenesis protein CcmH
MTLRRSLSALVLLFSVCLNLVSLQVLPAHALNPNEMLSDRALEKRARGLSAQLRCMVCQNQSIDDSDADLARDLRILVRERLVKGDTDDQVISFLVDRYGEFVLLKPRLEARTYLLWGFPIIVLLAGAGFIWRARRKATAQPARLKPLNTEEQARIRQLLDE